MKALGPLALACAACAGGPAAKPPARPAPVPATAITYAPGVARYRSASHQHVERRVDDQNQSSEAVLVAYVTATLAPHGGGLHATFTVDSVPQYASGAPGAPGADAARGATFSGTLSPDGRIATLASADSSVRLLVQLREQLQAFYPRIKAAGIAPGMRWTDSTRTTSIGSGVPLTVLTVSDHVVATPIDTLGTRALPIETHTSYSFTGTGSQAGEPFSVQGAGRRHTAALLSLAGRYLGLTAADTSSYTIALKAADMTIPAHQIRADTVSVLR